MDRSASRLGPRSAALVTAVLATAWLLPRTAPGLTFEDAGELTAAAVHLGVPHPPGYPLWTLLGAALVRIGESVGLEPARSLVLLSTAGAAAACAALAWLARSRSSSTPTAIAAGLLPLAAPTFTSQALIVEVYTLAAAFQAWSLAAAFADRPRPRICALMFGLGLAAHPSTLLLIAVPLVALLRAHRDGSLTGARGLAAVGAAGLGPTTFLYVPLASRRDPPIDWGDPEGGRRLLDHLLRSQYAGGGEAAIGPRLDFALEQLVLSWGALLLPLIALLLTGLADSARRRDAGLRAAVVASAAVGAWLALPFDLEPEVLRYRVAPTYLPAVLALAILAALGLDRAEGLCVRRLGPRLGGWLPPALLLLGAVPEPSTLAGACRMSADDGAACYAREALEAAPPDAILVLSRLGHTDVLGFPLLHAQLVEGRRSDVTLIDRATLALPWYREQLARRSPDLALAVARLDATLRSDPMRFADPREARLATVPFLQELFDGERPVVMVERPGDNVLAGREPTAGRSLWWISGATPPPEQRRGSCWPWLEHQSDSPWVRLLRQLAEERSAALAE
jgi:hypothetical protein